MASISIRDVEKRYQRSGAPAIEGLDLEIGDGEFLCLLGPSGCGKTTTLRMIAGAPLRWYRFSTSRMLMLAITCLQARRTGCCW